MTMNVQDTTINAGRVTAVPILLSNYLFVEGFVVAAAHDPSMLSLEDISIDLTETIFNGAEFAVIEVLPNGGTLGVVFDFEAPFDDNGLPPGENQKIANFFYRCTIPVVDPVETEVRLVDGVLGTPPKDNTVVVNAQSLPPELNPGRITCAPALPQEEAPVFRCGGLPDATGDPTELSARSGDTTDFCTYYEFPSSGPDGVQGLSMGLAYDCRLECFEETFEIPPFSLAAIIGVDFAHLQCDNDPNDGDGCEIIVRIIVD